MKILTQDLIDPALDFAVAKCMGYSTNVLVPGRGACRFLGVQALSKRGGHDLMPYRIESTLQAMRDADYPGVFLRETKFWDPSNNWAQGGPIIDLERISVLLNSDGVWEAGKSYEFFQSESFAYHRQSGPTALVAAMRCYVSSRLGDEVDVPEELI